MTPSTTRVRAAFGALLALLAVAACAADQPNAVCTASGEGFGDAKALTRRSLYEKERASGACMERLQAITSQKDLDKAFAELGEGDVPAVDFARESVVRREATRERGIKWVVARGDVVTVGVQACGGSAALECLIEIFAVSEAKPRAELHTCEAVKCSSITSEPIGSD